MPIKPPKGQEDYWQRVDQLFHEASHGHPVQVAALLSDVDPSANDYEALLAAAHGGHVEVVRLFVPYFKHTAGLAHRVLCEAAQSGSAGLVEMLLPIASPQVAGHEALVHAATEGHRDVTSILMAYADQDAVAEAIHGAASNGHLDVVGLLLPKAPDLRRQLDIHGKDYTPEATTLIQAHLDHQQLSGPTIGQPPRVKM